MADTDPFGQYIQVVVGITGASDSQVISIDPWDNCPDEIAKEEGLHCNECEFWGQEVRGIDWAEFSLCRFEKM
jgi:hypothetical protein